MDGSGARHGSALAGNEFEFRHPAAGTAQGHDQGQRIARGVWSEGGKLPSLEALMREFDVARVTVRQAVDLLAREGLVSAQQGRGTFVTGQPGAERSIRLETSLRTLAEVYRDDKPQLTLIEEASARTSSPRPLGTGTSWSRTATKLARGSPGGSLRPSASSQASAAPEASESSSP
jgi:DNA-binding transcriptional MocR family regulator